jgi:energy-coupling factor transport system ATP-binding protein
MKRTLAGVLQSLCGDCAAILAVTHDVEFAASYAGRCALLFDGRVMSEAEPHLFFSGNRFYTTAANRIARPWFPHAITCEEVTAACQSSSIQDAPALRHG